MLELDSEHAERAVPAASVVKDFYLAKAEQPKPSTLERLRGAIPNLEGYDKTLGALNFAIDRPLPEALVTTLISVRL